MAQASNSVRRKALQLLEQVIVKHRSLSDVLYPVTAASPFTGLSAPDRALLNNLVYGVLRFYFFLTPLVQQLQSKPFKDRDRDIEIVLLLGLYQIQFMRIPDHAAVNTSVELVKVRRKAWASGLVNAMLRRFVRERESLLEKIAQDPAAAAAHPDWMVDNITQDWPEQAADILLQNNTPAPLWIRVNTQKITLSDYRVQLQQQGIETATQPGLDAALRLLQACEASSLPGFNAGLVSVQDGAAQLAAPLLAVPADARVLDACAAPGGKSAHLLQQQPAIRQLVVLDRSQPRLDTLLDNLRRLGWSSVIDQHTVVPVCADAADPGQWPNDLGDCVYDRILLDAPCSATGVIRRHPDIKLLRRPSDIAQLADTQRRLLDAAWSLLKPGGELVYSTCSIFKQENQDQVQAFLQRHSDARALEIQSQLAFLDPVQIDVGCQIFPGQSYLDGFYYAKITKTTEP